MKELFRIYDSPDYVDRYTVVIMQESYRNAQGTKTYSCLACNSSPFHPQGFGQHSGCILGKHLGTRISIKDVTEDVQKFILQEFDFKYTLEDLVSSEKGV